MPNNCRIACVSLSEQPVAWSRTANALTGVAVRSRSQHSRFAVSNVSLSSSGDSIDNSNHELLTSQTGLTRQCLLYLSFTFRDRIYTNVSCLVFATVWTPGGCSQ